MLHREKEPQTLKNLHFLDKNDQTLYNFICGPSTMYAVHVQCTMYIVKWKLRCRVQRDHTYLCVHEQGV